MGCMIHYNWGSIRRELGPEKLFISKEGIESFIEDLFRYKTENISKVKANFLNEIRSNENIDCKGSFKDDFRVSQLCEQLGFDANKLIKQEYFWLLYDDAEVDDSSIIIQNN